MSCWDSDDGGSDPNLSTEKEVSWSCGIPKASSDSSLQRSLMELATYLAQGNNYA
jgi:hypothetical protein